MESSVVPPQIQASVQHVELVCLHGSIFLIRDEFEEFLQHTKLLRQLIFGGEGFGKHDVSKNPNCMRIDLFERWNIAQNNVLDIITLVKFERKPSDWIMAKMEDAYRTMEQLGGSDIIRSIYQKEMDGPVHPINPCCPFEDTDELFEWRTVISQSRVSDIDINMYVKPLEAIGFQHVHSHYIAVEGDFDILHRFRKRKHSDATDSGTEVD